MRGEQGAEIYQAAELHWITPACAGNREFVQALKHTGEDHPRLRGEQHAKFSGSPLSPGSPPLARGTDAFSRPVWCKWGITPACAGNRMAALIDLVVQEDHPRLRGEQGCPYSRVARTIGSPPLARGTDTTAADRARGAGITPACAGNSRRRISIACTMGDHPRLRGEQLHLIHYKSGGQGSPPLARGTEKYFCPPNAR